MYFILLKRSSEGPETPARSATRARIVGRRVYAPWWDTLARRCTPHPFSEPCGAKVNVNSLYNFTLRKPSTPRLRRADIRREGAHERGTHGNAITRRDALKLGAAATTVIVSGGTLAMLAGCEASSTADSPRHAAAHPKRNKLSRGRTGSGFPTGRRKPSRESRSPARSSASSRAATAKRSPSPTATPTV